MPERAIDFNNRRATPFVKQKQDLVALRSAPPPPVGAPNNSSDDSLASNRTIRSNRGGPINALLNEDGIVRSSSLKRYLSVSRGQGAQGTIKRSDSVKRNDTIKRNGTIKRRGSTISRRKSKFDPFKENKITFDSIENSDGDESDDSDSDDGLFAKTPKAVSTVGSNTGTNISGSSGANGTTNTNSTADSNQTTSTVSGADSSLQPSVTSSSSKEGQLISSLRHANSTNDSGNSVNERYVDHQ
ncbi:unnamed protein product [Ambrosiozyma monospora]|uniref:Unnamed protein product n=1 Tax=Ambrosiozyma monospora TaxID=43982 RepID=A0ACB5U3I0_AMBMO|nr:unnamed protein product [Ambrosiozyma monospora]